MKQNWGPIYPASAARIVINRILKEPIASRRISCSLNRHQLFHHTSSESLIVKITFWPFGEALTVKFNQICGSTELAFHMAIGKNIPNIRCIWGQTYQIEFLPQKMAGKVLINIESKFLEIKFRIRQPSRDTLTLYWPMTEFASISPFMNFHHVSPRNSSVSG